MMAEEKSAPTLFIFLPAKFHTVKIVWVVVMPFRAVTKT